MLWKEVWRYLDMKLSNLLAVLIRGVTFCI